MPERAETMARGGAVPDRGAPDVGGSARKPAGPGRILALGYGFFTLAAGARSGVQMGTHFHRAPVAYVLSAVAALIYLTGTVLIVRAERDPSASPWARRLCLLELAGVAAIGAYSLLDRDRFREPTVWSCFGSGYGFVPAALPVLALWWLHRRPSRTR